MKNTGVCDKNYFTNIFNNKFWGDGQYTSLSGGGSSLEYTENLRKQLPEVFEKFNIQSMLDAPCGDMWWMPSVLRNVEMDYTGGDIVTPLVEGLTKRFEFTEFKHLKFKTFDIVTDSFPDVDMWFCRDCLFHLVNEDIVKAFRNFANSNVKYIMTTTHLNESFGYDNKMFTANAELPPVGFRLLNLFAAPYNFPEPLYHCDDTFGPHPKREMCIWSREQIVTALESIA